MTAERMARPRPRMLEAQNRTWHQEGGGHSKRAVHLCRGGAPRPPPPPETGQGTFAKDAIARFESLYEGKTALALGPGITSNEETARFARDLVKTCPLPLVIDADGVNAFAGTPDLLTGSEASPVIITPHPGEMARLLGVSAGEIQHDRIGVARRFSMDHHVVTVLKGMRSIIYIHHREIKRRQ